MRRAEVLAGGLRYPETPRHGPDHRLYVSDQYERQVVSIDLATGERTTICAVPGQPSGIGWLPDGRMLVVSMTDRTVLRRELDGSLVRHASLADIATFHANDMIVDAEGRAYVGNFGFDLHKHYSRAAVRSFMPGLRVPTAALALIAPDGTVSRVADDLEFPNGMALLPDNVLVVAETLASKLTAYDVASDGSLSGRRVWADLRLRLIAPDGICADVEGGIWVAAAAKPAAYRVEVGGRITDAVRTSQKCFAVALSGPDRRTLVCCTAPTSLPHKLSGDKRGAVEIARVPLPGI